MICQINEQALEAAVEKSLTRTNLEELKGQDDLVAEAQEKYNTAAASDYYIGLASDFSPKYAIDEKRFWHFLENTQKEELEKIQSSSDWKLKILEHFDRMVKKIWNS